MWGFAGWVSDLVNGLSLLIAVGISTIAGRRQGKHPVSTVEPAPAADDGQLQLLVARKDA